MSLGVQKIKQSGLDLLIFGIFNGRCQKVEYVPDGLIIANRILQSFV